MIVIRKSGCGSNKSFLFAAVCKGDAQKISKEDLMNLLVPHGTVHQMVIERGKATVVNELS